MSVKTSSTTASAMRTQMKNERIALVELARATQQTDNSLVNLARNAGPTLTPTQEAAMVDLAFQHSQEAAAAREKLTSASTELRNLAKQAVASKTPVRLGGEKAVTAKKSRAKYTSLLMKTTYGGSARAADYTALADMRAAGGSWMPTGTPKRLCGTVPSKGSCPSGMSPYLTSASSVCCRKPRKKSAKGKGKRRSTPAQKYCLTV